MKAIIQINVIILLLLNWNITHAQTNLVPNGDFELFDSCRLQSYIDNADNWFSPYTPFASADYLNVCNPFPASVPQNYLGLQFPHSGSAYVGVDVFSNGANIREYIETKLIDTLKFGQIYCIKYFVSLAENYNRGTDGIGAYLSQDSIYYSSPAYGVLNLPAQIQNPSGNIITDTINWILIDGEFTAVGGEAYLTIGNFRDDANTQTTIQGNSNYSYFYIDDVSVTEGSCNVGIDVASSSNFTINISPNPMKDQFQITVPERIRTNLKYQVFAVDGISVSKGILQRNSATVRCDNWQSGLYLIQVYDEKGAANSTKLLKL